LIFSKNSGTFSVGTYLWNTPFLILFNYQISYMVSTNTRHSCCMPSDWPASPTNGHLTPAREALRIPCQTASPSARLPLVKTEQCDVIISFALTLPGCTIHCSAEGHISFSHCAKTQFNRHSDGLWGGRPRNW
jgi:hypothetical protein